MSDKIPWYGYLISVQPRIRLIRSFDQRNHNYLGYVLCVKGTIGNDQREFQVGIGKGAQSKHQMKVGDQVKGECLPVADSRLETVEYYKVSKLKILIRLQEASIAPPPWHGVPPDLPTFRQRGHRRLDPRTYSSKCISCIWGCRMPVEMIIDQWQPDRRPDLPGKSLVGKT